MGLLASSNSTPQVSTFGLLNKGAAATSIGPKTLEPATPVAPKGLSTTPAKVSVLGRVNSILHPPDNSKLGIVKNTITGLPKAAMDQVKEVIKGGAEFGLSAGEAPVTLGVGAINLLGKKNLQVPTSPVDIPGLDAVTGPLQSFQSQAAEGVKNGESVPRALGAGSFNTIANDPIGVAFKPVFMGAGLLSKAAKPLITDLVRSGEVSKITEILTKQFPGLETRVIQTVAPKIAQTSDRSTVEQLLSEATSQKRPGATQTTPQSMGSEVPRTSILKSQGGLKPTSLDLPLRPQTPSSLETLPRFNPDSYVADQVAKREGARIAETPTPIGRVKSFLAEAKAKLVDFSSPIEDTLNTATKKEGIKLRPTEDIHNNIDRVLRSPTLAGQFAKDNGIVDILKNVDKPDHLDQYLIAKHAQELAGRGIETGRDLTKDQALIKELGPKYESYAQKVSSYSKALLDYSTEHGLISKQLADTLKLRYPDYVPFQRVFTEIEKSPQYTGNKAVASLSSQNVIKNIEGSTRQIESPLRSLLAKTNDVFTQGEKNAAAHTLIGYKDLPGNPFQLRELKPDESAAHTVSYLDNGVKRTFATTKEVADAAKALNVQQMNILGKIFSLPTRIARIGITGINLPFVGANIAKDQVSAFINSDKALQTSVANPVNFTKALFAAVGHNDLYQEMVRAGGAGTSFDIARDQVPQTVERIRASRNIGSKALYTVRHPGELLRAVEDIVGRSEEFTRLQQYKGTKDALLKDGMSEADATAGAARAARDNTVNFARRGEWGTVLNSAFLYLNASIQGTRTLLRNLADKPVQTGSKIAIAALFPMASATAWNLSDPQRAAAYKDIPDYEKQNNIVIVPPNPTKDADGKWNVIKIPLSQEINNLVGMARRPVEAAYGLDPVKFSDFASALVGTVSPVAPTQGSVLSTLTPQAIKPTIEAAANKNLFTGLPEVPQSLERASPENQVRPTTSGTARKIGGLLGASPIKVEDFIKESAGGVGSQVLHASDEAMAAAGIIPKNEIGGTGVLSGITSRFNKAAGGATISANASDAQEALTAQTDKSAQLKTEAQSEFARLKSLPKDQAAAQFDELSQSSPDLATQIANIANDNAKGLDYSDKIVAQLQVKNGDRAKYLAQKFNALPTKEAKAALWESYTQKKIITAEVADQLSSLLKQ